MDGAWQVLIMIGFVCHFFSCTYWLVKEVSTEQVPHTLFALILVVSGSFIEQKNAPPCSFLDVNVWQPDVGLTQRPIRKAA